MNYFIKCVPKLDKSLKVDLQSIYDQDSDGLYLFSREVIDFQNFLWLNRSHNNNISRYESYHPYLVNKFNGKLHFIGDLAKEEIVDYPSAKEYGWPIARISRPATQLVYPDQEIDKSKIELWYCWDNPKDHEGDLDYLPQFITGKLSVDTLKELKIHPVAKIYCNFEKKFI